MSSYLEQVSVADTMNIHANMEQYKKNLSSADKALLEKIGLNVYWMKILHNQYFPNSLATVLDSIVRAQGGNFVDVNKAMTGMGKDKEFYVDYCHLTPFGNQFVAEQLEKEVAVFLERKFQSSNP